jgi:hypothetical protein
MTNLRGACHVLWTEHVRLALCRRGESHDRLRGRRLGQARDPTTSTPHDRPLRQRSGNNRDREGTVRSDRAGAPDIDRTYGRGVEVVGGTTARKPLNVRAG